MSSNPTGKTISRSHEGALIRGAWQASERDRLIDFPSARGRDAAYQEIRGNDKGELIRTSIPVLPASHDRAHNWMQTLLILCSYSSYIWSTERA